MINIKVEKCLSIDIENIVEIACENFSDLKNKEKEKEWIKCNFGAFPRMQYFVATYQDLDKEEEENCLEIGEDIRSYTKVVGYILWVEKGGFKDESVWELEQIAIKKSFQENGIDAKLIVNSLGMIKKYLKERGSTLKLIEVTTPTLNSAQYLYEKTLGAKVECIIKDFFRGDEAIMIARFNKD